MLSDRSERATPPGVVTPKLDREGLLRIQRGDLGDWAASHEVDVPELIERCLDDVNARRQLNSWKRLVPFLDQHGADGAAGEDLALIGPSLAVNIDDERLLQIVAAIPKDQFDSLPFALSWRFQYDKLSPGEQGRLRTQHPDAVRAIEDEIQRRSPQNNRPEADPEGPPPGGPDPTPDGS